VLPTTAATDEVYRRVAAGEPFRSAYRAVGEHPEAVTLDPTEAWRERTHLGAPGALEVGYLEERLDAARGWLEDRRRRVAEVWELLA
jgi:hypothetical protein